MMIGYPLLRKKMSNTAIFKTVCISAVCGYLIILLLCFTGLSGILPLLFIPGAIVFASNGILTVLTTVFLSNTVDYGELMTGRREESVIFSMQTFVVKLASGVSVFIAGLGLDIIGLKGNSDQAGPAAAQSASTLQGLRLLMTIMPTIVLVAALLFFGKRFLLTDSIVRENSDKLNAKHRLQQHETG